MSSDEPQTAFGSLGPQLRIGHGYDLHRLGRVGAGEPGPAEGRPLVIGGVRFIHDRGPVAHSDGDALLHAITDAILGALGLPDIGQLFPDSDPRWAGAESGVFVEEARRRASEAGWAIANIDATLILERPRIGDRKEEVRRNVARLLRLGVDQVNVKAKTHEKVDAVGEERAIEAHAVVLMIRQPGL